MEKKETADSYVAGEEQNGEEGWARDNNRGKGTGLGKTVAEKGSSTSAKHGVRHAREKGQLDGRVWNH